MDGIIQRVGEWQTMKNSFVLYTDYRQHIDLLSVEEKAQLLDAIFKYADGENDIELDGMAGMAFSFIRAQMDRDNEKYERICEKRRAVGKLGGAPKGNKNAEKQAKQPNGLENNQNNQMVFETTKTTKNNQKQPKQAKQRI